MPESTEIIVRFGACFESFNIAAGGTIQTMEAFVREMERRAEIDRIFREMLPPRHVHTNWLRWLGFRIDEETASWVSPFFGAITWDDAVFRWR